MYVCMYVQMGRWVSGHVIACSRTADSEHGPNANPNPDAPQIVSTGPARLTCDGCAQVLQRRIRAIAK